MGLQDFKTEEARSTRINVLWVYAGFMANLTFIKFQNIRLKV